jgi:HD-like signal output (HDOD) protein
MLPSAAMQLAALARKADVEHKDILRLLETEPLVAASVLRIAQSPVYRRAEPLRTLHDAISRLGLRTLADVFLQAALATRIFRAPGLEKPLAELRRHSVATAHVARIVCRYRSIYDEYAFTCGLLHDVGAAAAMIALADEGRAGKRVHPAAMIPAVFEVHEECVELLAAAWKLPAELRLVLAHHHYFVIDHHPHPLAAVVCVADAVADELGYAFAKDLKPAMADKARAALELGEPTMDLIRTEARAVLSQIVL